MNAHWPIVIFLSLNIPALTKHSKFSKLQEYITSSFASVSLYIIELQNRGKTLHFKKLLCFLSFPNPWVLPCICPVLFVYLVQFAHSSILIHFFLACSVFALPFENDSVITLMLEVFSVLTSNKAIDKRAERYCTCVYQLIFVRDCWVLLM